MGKELTQNSAVPSAVIPAPSFSTPKLKPLKSYAPPTPLPKLSLPPKKEIPAEKSGAMFNLSKDTTRMSLETYAKVRNRQPTTPSVESLRMYGLRDDIIFMTSQSAADFYFTPSPADIATFSQQPSQTGLKIGPQEMYKFLIQEGTSFVLYFTEGYFRRTTLKQCIAILRKMGRKSLPLDCVENF